MKNHTRHHRDGRPSAGDARSCRRRPDYLLALQPEFPDPPECFQPNGGDIFAFAGVTLIETRSGTQACR